MREECDTWLQRHPPQVGGIDDNGEAVIAEIDGTKYFHRKYNRGHWRERHWVFGGIEKESGNCFMVEVPTRRVNTMEALIENHILPGTEIMSDGWAGYVNIDQIGNGIYTHPVVIHDRHFANQTDTQIHTQNVENLWMRAKRKLKRQFGTSRVTIHIVS